MQQVYPICDTDEMSFNYTLSLINSKYILSILHYLSADGAVLRFNELKRRIDTISFKTLSCTLKQMEADGLIIRREYPQIPPKVEYSLSEKGRSLLPLLELMREWAQGNKS